MFKQLTRVSIPALLMICYLTVIAFVNVQDGNPKSINHETGISANGDFISVMATFVGP